MDIEQLKLFIQKIARKTLGNSVQETIISGTITQSCVENTENGLVAGYMVQSQDREQPVFATAIGEKVFSVDDNVYLINSVVGGSSSYHIFDLVSSANQMYNSASEYDRFIRDLESSYQSIEQKELFFNDAFIEEEIYSINSAPTALINLNTYGCFDIFATFDLNKNLNDFADYGIEVQLLGENGTVLEKHFLNTHYFNGQPYKIGKSTQHRFVQLKEGLKGSVKVVKLKYYAKKSSVEDAKVTISNVQVDTGSILEYENKFSLSLSAKDGKTHISKEKDENISITAIGKFLTQELSAETLKYFWFVADDSITEESIMEAGSTGFNPLAGAGWRCLTLFSWAEVATGADSTENSFIKLWNANSNFYNFKS